MMQWIATVGTIAASRVACGNVVLGAMDDIDFVHPVKVGEVAMLRAQVELIGRSSLEVGVRVFSENVHTGARAVTLNSHLVFIKVDEQLHPQPVPARIEPQGREEETLYAAALDRRQHRQERLTRRSARASRGCSPRGETTWSAS
jgi:acyl-CoA hydrolase